MVQDSQEHLPLEVIVYADVSIGHISSFSFHFWQDVFSRQVRHVQPLNPGEISSEVCEALLQTVLSDKFTLKVHQRQRNIKCCLCGSFFKKKILQWSWPVASLCTAKENKLHNRFWLWAPNSPHCWLAFWVYSGGRSFLASTAPLQRPLGAEEGKINEWSYLKR